MLKFELVSPERMLASREAGAVTVPGQMGDMTAMPGHAAFLTTLRPGFVTVDADTRYVVTGGFAEISGDTVSVLAEEAIEASEVTQDWVNERIEVTEKMLSEAGPERFQAVQQALMDFQALLGRV